MLQTAGWPPSCFPTCGQPICQQPVGAILFLLKWYLEMAINNSLLSYWGIRSPTSIHNTMEWLTHLFMNTLHALISNSHRIMQLTCHALSPITTNCDHGLSFHPSTHLEKWSLYKSFEAGVGSAEATGHLLWCNAIVGVPHNLRKIHKFNSKNM